MGLNTEMLALVPKLRAQAWALTGRASDVDDLVQEAMMRAWQFRHTFQPGSNLKAWMFRILRNAFLASLPDQRRTVSDADGRFTRRLSLDADQEWRVHVGELLSAFAELPKHHRDALLLIAGAGLTYEQAAEALGCSVGTIKSRVSRARAQLAELVEVSWPDRRLDLGAQRPTGSAFD
jgi:RNA polymerase sigma-70 factor (ECF subfamily)